MLKIVALIKCTPDLAGDRHLSAHRFAQGTATYGGTVEVFHGIIAQHVLGLPRPSYPGSKVLVSRKRDAAAA